MKVKELFESIDNDLPSELGPQFVDLVGYDKYMASEFPTLFANTETVDGVWNAKAAGGRMAAYNANGRGLTSLKGAPREIVGSFRVYGCKLTSFEHAPEKVTGDVNLSRNKFTSLHNIHKYFKEIGDKLYAEDMDIKDSVLGVLLIKNLQSISLDNNEVARIVNRYLPNSRGKNAVIDCQEELIDAGFEEYAKL